MSEPSLILAAAQAGDGFGMNAMTLGVIGSVIAALVGAITVLYRTVLSNERQQIVDLRAEKRALEEENRELTEALIDALRTGHRATDVADEAARELLKRRAKRPT